MVAKHTLGRIKILIVMIGVWLSFGTLAQDVGWLQYKQRFLLSDGRIVDTGNNHISHSEGQGFAMLLAVYNNDQAAFDSIWQWTKANLYREDIGLFSWRYQPGQPDPIADKNNATDGDIFIAWALLEGGKQWDVTAYRDASAEIQKSLLRHTLVSYAGYQVMLPGVNGFKQNDFVIVNPSYFVFPAWEAFYQDTNLLVWKNLSDDSLALLKKMMFGKQQLATDWVSLQADGQVTPANGWPARFGFDAVRIPLYIHWYQMSNPTLSPYVSFWRGFDRRSAPAWIDVLSGQRSEYNQSQGMRAVRDLVVGDSGPLVNRLDPDEDYYSASLHLLAYWSQRNLFLR
ncbi:glycosyl hydrolase family 8 [Serratia sp. UGAL515B_01]|uniref:glycosyl hydrolase family 8 n=1 Tax=Serratia sp. UGAL515B_01 TaxID=2986763 RepID=UPI002955DC67|nr:glycosyl hydrolase family 8 [Serratia sp. UGAL515B_01]WON78083.1 glycosyl hydrolase family 8 [Serratia sp. UGAL515B_01]